MEGYWHKKNLCQGGTESTYIKIKCNLFLPFFPLRKKGEIKIGTLSLFYSLTSEIRNFNNLVLFTADGKTPPYMNLPWLEHLTFVQKFPRSNFDESN